MGMLLTRRRGGGKGLGGVCGRCWRVRTHCDASAAASSRARDPSTTMEAARAIERRETFKRRRRILKSESHFVLLG